MLGANGRFELIQAVEDALGMHYPEQAPWTILTEEKEDGGTKDRIYAQITQRFGQMQPVHWDTGADWFENANGVWAPLSIILHVNDDLSTCLPCAPLTTLSRSVPQLLFDDVHPKEVARRAERVLTHLDEKVKTMRFGRSGATQCLAFHSGEQPHAGMSWDGHVDPELPNFKGRVVVYFFAVPASVHAKAQYLELFNSEYPFGLLKHIFEEQVSQIFYYFKSEKFFRREVYSEVVC
jgi:hypothetical protein